MTLGAFFSELGLSVSEPVLDGQIHRVAPTDKPSDKTGWYVGYLAPYKVVVAGDWRRPAERSIWKEHQKASIPREELARIKRLVHEAKSKAEWERSELARAAGEEARAMVKQATISDHPYLFKKNIDKLEHLSLNGYVIVPLSVGTNKVIGLQKIPEHGKKLFLTGQSNDGACFCFKGDDTRVLLCEGYATGASLHMATGATVYCAMSAGNLSKAARWIRKQHHSSAIVVCGDDDRWKPEKGNAGRRSAVKAAEVAQGAVVFPQFSSDEGQPTDFNDLHCREGLARVRELVSDPEGASRFMVPLGRVGLRVFVYESDSQTLVEFSQFMEVEFLHLAPLEYWAGRYPGKDDVPKWSEARNDLIQAAKRVGNFDETMVRGGGIWE